eukprot:2009244-Pleurochrysis_carterae.AAC.1
MKVGSLRSVIIDAADLSITSHVSMPNLNMKCRPADRGRDDSCVLISLRRSRGGPCEAQTS